MSAFYEWYNSIDGQHALDSGSRCVSMGLAWDAAIKYMEALKPIAQQPQAKTERGGCGNCGQKCDGFDEIQGGCDMWIIRSASAVR